MTLVYGLVTAAALAFSAALAPYLRRISRAPRPMRLRSRRRLYSPLFFSLAVATAGGAVVLDADYVILVYRELLVYAGIVALATIFFSFLSVRARSVVAALVVVLVAVPVSLLWSWERPPAQFLFTYLGSSTCSGTELPVIGVVPGAAVSFQGAEISVCRENEITKGSRVDGCVAADFAILPDFVWWIGPGPLFRYGSATGPPSHDDWSLANAARVISRLSTNAMTGLSMLEVTSVLLRFEVDGTYLQPGNYSLLTRSVQPTDR